MTAARNPGDSIATLGIADWDERLRNWAIGLLGDIDVSFEPPVSKPEGKGVSIYLYEVRPEAALRNRAPPMVLSVRYLMSTWAQEPSQGHAMLADLMFAALEDPEMELDPGPFPVEAWASLGAPIRPSFILRLPLRRERDTPQPKLVRQRLVVQTAELRAIQGVVLGPQDIPIAGAQIEVPLLNLSTSTDSHGRFSFAPVPGGASPTNLRVIAKGRELTVAVRAASDEPLVIHFGPLED